MTKNEFMTKVINDKYEKRRLEKEKKNEAHNYCAIRGQRIWNMINKEK